MYQPVDTLDDKFSFQNPGDDGGLPNEANMKVSILSSVNYNDDESFNSSQYTETDGHRDTFKSTQGNADDAIRETEEHKETDQTFKSNSTSLSKSKKANQLRKKVKNSQKIRLDYAVGIDKNFDVEDDSDFTFKKVIIYIVSG